MENYPVMRLESPRGPVYSPIARANFQLGHRAARGSGIRISDMEGILAREFADMLPDADIPSDRMVRQWAHDMNDYPERMIEAGIISVDDVASFLRPFLNSNAYQAPMQPHLRLSLVNPDYPQNTQEPESEGLLEGLSKLALFIAGICAVGSIIEGLLNLTGKTNTSPQSDPRGRPLSVRDRGNYFRYE